jgi:hypothetical protein
VAGIETLKVGDIVQSVAGDGVTWPHSRLSYRVTSISSDRIVLEIVPRPAEGSKALIHP